MITLSSTIQSERRDCIVVCSDLQIAIRANGEEVTSMVDIAGNMYPAGIPVPETEPGLALGAVVGTALANGYYCYAYVYAAKNRYPYIDAGKAMRGSIAPRGNPSDFTTINVTGGPRKVNVTLTGSSRLDIDQIIIYRTVMWSSAEDAELAANAGEMFSVGLVDNTIPSIVFTDDLLEPTSTEQIEYDNNFAPTVQNLAYESPYLWGIGNNPLVKEVTWVNNVLSLTDKGKWFSGRNGQLATVTGITSGGIDGRGTFIFKAGNPTSDRPNNSAILTIDGDTPEILIPSSGRGFLTVTGPATTLYRSKPRNPLAWGETVYSGTGRFAQLFARRISGSKATAIAVVPGGEYLKIDVKDPSKAYTFSLRTAGTPNFESSRREISDISVSHHFSQFVAALPDGQKVLWGWDIDNHAILESDGNTQKIVSQNIFNTLRRCQSETLRAQYAQGFCNENLELNIMFLPWGNDINATDLAVFQHYPSGKWSTALVGDTLATCTIRDPLTNLLRYLAGKDTGRIVEHQLEAQYQNQFNTAIDIENFPADNYSIAVDTSGALFPWTGGWATWYSNADDKLKMGRIISVNLDILTNFTIITFDKITLINGESTDYDEICSITPGSLGAKLMIGSIPTFFEKIVELGNPSMLKKAESISVSGDITTLTSNDPGVLRLYLYNPDFSEIERYPNHDTNGAYDNLQANQGNYVFRKTAIAAHPKIAMRMYLLSFDRCKLRTLNLDIR